MSCVLFLSLFLTDTGRRTAWLGEEQTAAVHARFVLPAELAVPPAPVHSDVRIVGIGERWMVAEVFSGNISDPQAEPLAEARRMTVAQSIDACRVRWHCGLAEARARPGKILGDTCRELRICYKDSPCCGEVVAMVKYCRAE